MPYIDSKDRRIRHRLSRVEGELRGIGGESSNVVPPELSIVLPCLNEEASLLIVVEQIASVLPDDRYEVVLVDDGSEDNTWHIIRHVVQRQPHWQGVRLSRRFGHQAALLAGLQVARGEAVITMDSDGQHPPRLIPEMLTAWRAGAKVVQMVRQPAKYETWGKRITSRLFYRFFSNLCEVPITPAAADFRLLDRQVVDTVLRSRGPVPFLRGLIPWMGWKTTTIEFQPEPRLAGQTQYSRGRMLRLALDGLMSFSIVPLRLGIWAGLITSILSFGYLCYIAAVGLLSHQAVPGWASIAGLVALLGGVQLLCIGLLGEYLGRLYLTSLDRPRYIVRDKIMPRKRRETSPDSVSRMERKSSPSSTRREALHVR